MNLDKIISQNAHYSSAYPFFIKSIDLMKQRRINFNSQRVQFLDSIDEAKIILPSIFKELIKQSKFITFIGSPKPLNKKWFIKNHLRLNNFMQINTAKPTIQSMRLVLQALSHGQSSAVVTWLSETTNEQIKQLEQAAEFGNSKVYILPLPEIRH